MRTYGSNAVHSYTVFSGTIHARMQMVSVLLGCSKGKTLLCPFSAQRAPRLDLGDGQFSKRCDVDGSFFNSDAIQILFEKA